MWWCARRIAWMGRQVRRQDYPRRRTEYSPVEHDPLRYSDDALLRLIKGGELRLDAIIGVGHGGSRGPQSRLSYYVQMSSPRYACSSLGSTRLLVSYVGVARGDFCLGIVFRLKLGVGALSRKRKLFDATEIPGPASEQRQPFAVSTEVPGPSNNNLERPHCNLPQPLPSSPATLEAAPPNLSTNPERSFLSQWPTGSPP